MQTASSYPIRKGLLSNEGKVCMTIAQSFLGEFDSEMKITRSLLERVPEKEAAWKPHPKSSSLGHLAAHIANLPRWASGAVEYDELDVSLPVGEGFRQPPFDTTSALLERFDRNVEAAKKAVSGATDEHLAGVWTLRNGDKKIVSMPRTAVLRSFVVSHLVHHRGQLSVYLRLRDVPLPRIYGPTADTP